ncbi:hypothetical protein ASG25_07515 [Rhizobium sp. Leaf384]|uniref:hypothetical protein n=1 Tax=unclassified Rhizobium TaxID=2613769 RepID=UPI0007163FB0|nr:MULTISPECIES: hypothetical protein [unclassified Rhizobium]KQS81310.1 hypothetical protein ASG25_07515 [Rhizobium sp. Leaf384]KQS87218.1 hypothetical protein ASG58_03075 [Rhizobium sp. Leaf383]
MCGLCGAFANADHWSQGGDAARMTDAVPAVERMRQAAAANRVLALRGLKLSVWADRFVLRGPTGRSVVVDHLGTLWTAADSLGACVDPLDAGLMSRLEDDQT